MFHLPEQKQGIGDVIENSIKLAINAFKPISYLVLIFALMSGLYFLSQIEMLIHFQ